MHKHSHLPGNQRGHRGFLERCRDAAAVTSLLLVCAAPAAAQDEGRVGLTMGFPAAIGFEFQVSRHIALRPEVTFSRYAYQPPEIEYTGWGIGVGLSVPLYLHETDRFAAYVAPRLSFSRAVDFWPASDMPAADVTADSYQVAGSFGATCALGRRLSLYGDLGVAYTFLRGSVHSYYHSVWKIKSWEPRVSVGAILYL